MPDCIYYISPKDQSVRIAHRFLQCTNYHLYISVPVFKIGLFRAMTYVSAPVSIVKTGISLIQLAAACINVGIVDASERAKDEKKSDAVGPKKD